MKNYSREVKMGKYKKCPRCELNWIMSEEDLCEVCKAELGKASKISLIEEDEDELLEERICPVCKVNYLADDEDICPACKAEQSSKKVEKPDEDEAWTEYVEDDEPIAPVEEEVSLSLLQEEEEEDEDDEETSVDDFDESIPDFDEGYLDDDEDEDDEEDDIL